MLMKQMFLEAYHNTEKMAFMKWKNKYAKLSQYFFKELSYPSVLFM